MISISQICNQDFCVKFTQEKCQVFNKLKNCVLERTRYFDYCYFSFTNVNIDNFNDFAYFSEKEEVASIIVQNLNHIRIGQESTEKYKNFGSKFIATKNRDSVATKIS